VKRFLVLLTLVVLPIVQFPPTADAVGIGGCTITGTVHFSPPKGSEGQWSIEGGVIDCQGIIAARRRILAPGPFKGSGSYTALPDGGGACLHQAGSGTLDYRIPTSGGDILISEPIAYTLVGAGSFTTQTLRGTFELKPPYDGDCVTKPVSSASFVAEALLYRYARELPTPPGPPGLVPQPHLPGPGPGHTTWPTS